MNEEKIKEETKNLFIKRIMILFYFFVILVFAGILISPFFLKPAIYNSEKEYNLIKELNKENLLDLINFEKKITNATMRDYISLIFAKFARYPYEKEKYFSSENKKFMNFDIINFGNKSEDNYFFTFKNDSLKTVIISFPGTLTTPQLLEEAYYSELINFDESNKNILVGRYFGERTKSLLELIFNEELEKLIKKNYHIISTGHSLGGAMAQCFMYFALVKGKIRKNNFPITITYGQPKVGNYYFSNYLDNNAFLNVRFVNKDDLVHKIPFCSGFFNHTKYILDWLEDVVIYSHTKIQINQHNLCNLPWILNFLLKIVKLIGFLFELLIICFPIFIIFILLYFIYSIWSEINNKNNNRKCFYIFFCIFFIIILYLCMDFTIFIKYSYFTSFIFAILELLGFLIITYLIIVFAIQICCLGAYLSYFFKYIDDIKEKTIKDFCNCKNIFLIVSAAVSSLWASIKYLINIHPHLTYQKTIDWENMSEEDKNRNQIRYIVSSNNFGIISEYIDENEKLKNYENVKIV